MTLDEFETLLKRRDEKQREHDRACEILAEEPHPFNHKRCVRLYDEIAALQEQIDQELAREAASGL
jgi:hypothetical protein